jgi:hypothetical protein
MAPPTFWRHTRRSEEFIHYRGKSSRGTKPLAIDFRPLGREIAGVWPSSVSA